MFINIFANFVGLILFLFYFWRRLKEDYHSNLIFSAGFIFLFSGALGYVISLVLLPSWWFWFTFIASLFGFAFSISKYKLRLFETFEAVYMGMLPWLSLIFFTSSVLKRNLYSFFAFAFVIFLMAVFYFLEDKYKNFSWYKSGRVGFSGLLVLGIFFLSRAVLAIFLPTVISFVSQFETLLSGIASLIIFSSLYYLSRKL